MYVSEYAVSHEPRRGELATSSESRTTPMIGAQACVNIGVVTSALPNKGMSLPFISYGGSNLLMMLVCVGLLISIARHASDDVVVVEKDSSDTVFMAAATT